MEVSWRFHGGFMDSWRLNEVLMEGSWDGVKFHDIPCGNDCYIATENDHGHSEFQSKNDDFS